MKLRFWRRRKDYTPRPKGENLWALLKAHREGAFQMLVEELFRFDESDGVFRPAIKAITPGGLRRVHKRVVRRPVDKMRKRVQG